MVYNLIRGITKSSEINAQQRALLVKCAEDRFFDTFVSRASRGRSRRFVEILESIREGEAFR